MSAGVTELLLKVSADPSGLAALATQFEALEKRIVASAGRAQGAIGRAGGSGASGAAELARMRGQLDEVTAATRTLGAAQDALTTKVEEGGRRRARASGEAKRGIESEAQAISKMANAESAVTQMVIADKVKLDATRRRLTQDRVAADFKAAQAMAEAEAKAVQMVIAGQLKQKAEMDKLRHQRQVDDLRAAEQRAAAELKASHVAAATAQRAQLLQAQRANTEALKQEAHAHREVHSSARGLAGGLGLLWTTYGSMIPLIAGFAVASGMKAAIKASSEFQYQMTFVGALTRKETESMGQAMARMGGISAQVLEQMERSLFAPKEGAEAMRQLAQAGLSAEQALAALPAVLNLATVGEMKVADAAFSAVAIMHAFGKETKDVTLIVNELSKAASMSTTSVQSITESVKQASVVGEQYGITLEETLASLTLLADVGIRGTAAGTAFRNMVTGLFSPTKQAGDVLKQLGVEAFDSQGKIRPLGAFLGDLRTAMEKLNKEGQLEVINAVSTERGAKALSTLLNHLDRFGPLLDQIGEKSRGFAQQTTDALLTTVKGEWLQAMNSLEAAFIRVGQASSGELLTAVTKLKDVFRSEEFKQGAAAVVSSFAQLSAWVASNGSTVVNVIEGVLAYKAGKFLWPAAAAGIAAISGGLAGIAAAVGSLGAAAKGGLVGLALFGGWEAGSWLSKFQVIRDTAVNTFTPVYELIQDVDDFLARRNGGRPGEGFSRRSGAIGRANASATPLTLGQFRQREIEQAGGTRSIAGLSTGAAAFVSAKELKEAAQAEYQTLLAHYRSMEAASQGHFSAEMTILRAYRDARLITDSEYEARASAAQNAFNQADLARENQKINALQAVRKKLIDSKRDTVKIDAEIERAYVEMFGRRQKAEVAAVQDAIKAWKEYNTAGQSVLEGAQKANAELQAEVDQLKEGTVHRKDATLAKIAGRIATEEDTLARLRNTTAGWDQSEMVTSLMQADVAEIKVIEDRIAALKKERETRKDLLKEREQLENSWAIGAQRGLDNYLQASLSTAKIVEDAFKKGFTAMEDALVTFVRTGKFSFKEFANAVLDDLTRMLVRMLILQPIAMALRNIISGNGGSFGGAGGGGVGAGDLMSGAGTLGSLYSFGSGVWTGAGTGMAGGAGAWVGNLFGSGGVGGYLGYGANVGMGASEIGTAAAANSGGMPAWAGAAGWASLIAAGMLVNDGMFQRGWRADNQDRIARSGPDAGFIYGHDRLFRGMGMSDRLASLLSGSSLSTRLWGHGPVNADAFGVRGSVSGSTFTGENWQDYSRRGGVFRSDERWQEPSALSGDQNTFIATVMRGITGMTGRLGTALGVDPEALLANYRSRDFNAQLSNNGEPISSEEMNALFGQFFGEVLQGQVSMLLEGAGRTELAKYVAGLTGTVDEITASISEFIGIMEVIPTLNMKGLDVEALLAWKQGNETLGETFTRVATQLANFDDAFMTEAQKLNAAQTSVTTAFTAMNIAIPASKEEFYNLVHGLDLSTEAGRNMFDRLMQIAPAFATVAEASAAFASQLASDWASIQDLIAQYSPGGAGGNDLQRAVSGFQAGNAWAAGMTPEQLIATLRTISEADLANYARRDEEMGTHFVDLIREILRLGLNVQGLNETLVAGAGSGSASNAASADLFNANLRPGPTYEWNGRQWVNTDPNAGTGTGAGTAAGLDQEFNGRFGELFSGRGNRLDRLSARRRIIGEQIGDNAATLTGMAAGPDRDALIAWNAQLQRQYGTDLPEAIVRLTALNAEYGEELGGNLFDLQEWYDAQRLLMAGNNEALLELEVEFGRRRADLIEQANEEMLRAQRQIGDWLRGLLLDNNLSPLTPTQRLNFAESQYNENLLLARSGDADALANYTTMAQAYLTELRGMFGSDSAYLEAFARIGGDAAGLAGLAGARPPTANDLQTGFGSVVNTLIDLQTAVGLVSSTIIDVDGGPPPTFILQGTDLTPYLTSIQGLLGGAGAVPAGLTEAIAAVSQDVQINTLTTGATLGLLRQDVQINTLTTGGQLDRVIGALEYTALWQNNAMYEVREAIWGADAPLRDSILLERGLYGSASAAGVSDNAVYQTRDAVVAALVQVQQAVQILTINAGSQATAVVGAIADGASKTTRAIEEAGGSLTFSRTGR